MMVSRGMILLKNNVDVPNSAQTAITPDTDGGLFLPAEMLRDAGISPQDELEYIVEDGVITLERSSFRDEPVNDVWDSYEGDEVLKQLPCELRELLIELHIHPAAAKQVILEGGYEL